MSNVLKMYLSKEEQRQNISSAQLELFRAPSQLMGFFCFLHEKDIDWENFAKTCSRNSAVCICDFRPDIGFGLTKSSLDSMSNYIQAGNIDYISVYIEIKRLSESNNSLINGISYRDKWWKLNDCLAKGLCLGIVSDFVLESVIAPMIYEYVERCPNFRAEYSRRALAY